MVPWSITGSAPISVTDTAAAYANNRVYSAGGVIDFATDTLYEYMQVWNRTTNSWVQDTTQAIPLPAQADGGGYAFGAACADSAGRIHYVNGATPVAGSPGFYYIWAAHQLYDPSAAPGSRWSFLSAPMLASGQFYYSWYSGCFFLGEFMYLFGGYASLDGVNVAVTDVTWRYDPATDTWTDTGHLMNDPRVYMAYAKNVAGTGGFASGGSSDISGLPVHSTNERYQPATGWTLVKPFPAGAGGGRMGHGMSVVGTTVVYYGGATYDAVNSTFVLQANSLKSGNNGNGNVGNLGRELNSPRWFGVWAGSGSAATLAGFYGMGSDGTQPVNTAERLP
jgi:hypothetical protein